MTSRTYFILIYFFVATFSASVLGEDGVLQVYISLASGNQVEDIFLSCSELENPSNYSEVVRVQGEWVVPQKTSCISCFDDDLFIRYNWTQPTTNGGCCVTKRKSICDVGPSSTRVMCNNTVLEGIKQETIRYITDYCQDDCNPENTDTGEIFPPPSESGTKIMEDLRLNLTDCSSESLGGDHLASEYKDNYCVFLLQDSGYDFSEGFSRKKRNAEMDSEMSEVDEVALTSALLNYKQFLCIGTIAHNIDRVVRPAQIFDRTPSSKAVNSILRTLDATFEDDFSLNWANRRFQDTQDVVENTEGMLQILVNKVRNDNGSQRNFTFKGINAEYHIMKLEVAGPDVFLFPTDDQVTSDLLEQISVNISLHNTCNKYKRVNGCTVVVGIAIMDNFLEYIQETIEDHESSNRSSRKGDSVLLSIIIQSAERRIKQLGDESIKLTFTPKSNISNSSQYQGNFLESSRLAWNTSGLSTEVLPDGRIEVKSSHLTSFAVLVSPTGVVSYRDDVMINNILTKDGQRPKSRADELVLDIVSYIGCTISILSLSLAIWFLIAFRDNQGINNIINYGGRSSINPHCLLVWGKLKKGVLLYVHLNLCVSLLMALMVFVAGVDLARSNEVLCIIVASLIQYLFLCMFMWMLGEGILLYILIVKIFVKVDKKWRLLIPLCWGLPLPLVVVSAAVLRDDYRGHTNGYCWISADPEKPAIWTFLCPLIIILSVNALFLVLSMCSIWKTRKVTTANEHTLVLAAKDIIKGSIVLLPLLGFPWIIGLFAVNSKTTVFAWIFTIVNTLQGFFIFIVHVVRNDYVWTRIKKLVSTKLLWKRMSTDISQMIMTGKHENSRIPDVKLGTELENPSLVRDRLVEQSSDPNNKMSVTSTLTS